jgi:DNA-binding response OmpR family regulator
MATPDDKKKSVIIVDDDTDLLRMLVFAFKAEGYPVVGFENGKDATDYLNSEQNLDGTCLIILDRLLPDMDGIEILKSYSGKFNKHIPVMFLSVLSGERDVLTGLKEGAVEYVTKPFSLPILLEKATNLIQRFA